MDNLEYLKKVKEFDEANDMFHKLGAEEFLIYRRAKALEIIAEELITLNDFLDGVSNSKYGESIRVNNMF